MNNLKFVVASDLHGSMLALERLLDIVTEKRADRLILLGDVFGTNASEMVKKLNTIAYKVVCVKGNNDWYFEPDGADFEIFSQTYYNINGNIAYLSHGHKLNWFNMDDYGAKIIMFGHYHYPILKRDKNLILLCPGSIAFPRNGSGKSYAYIEGDLIQICSIENRTLLELKI